MVEDTLKMINCSLGNLRAHVVGNPEGSFGEASGTGGWNSSLS